MSASDDLPPAMRLDHPLLGLGYSKPVKRRPLTRLDGAAGSPGEAPVSEEVPIALVYNARPHVVMMGTPADLEDFAVGFTLTEGIVARAADISAIEVVKHSQGVEVHLSIPEAMAGELKERGRALIGRAGCGLCGVETIQEALREHQPVPPGERIAVEALWRAERELPSHQIWNRDTGSLHAAAWARADGAIEVAREDVGRHNALDKVVGARARSGEVFEGGFMVITSRASYELVQKCAAVGIRLLAAVSRPTGLAIGLAEATGITLVALLRGSTANVYAHSERLKAPAE